MTAFYSIGYAYSRLKTAWRCRSCKVWNHSQAKKCWNCGFTRQPDQ